MRELTMMFDGIKNGWHRAMQRSIVRTLTTGKAITARRISETVNLRIRDIKTQIVTKKPNFRNLVGSLHMSRKPVPLIKYMSGGQMRRAKTLRLKKKKSQRKFRQVRAVGGVTVKVRKGGPNEKFPESFVERVASGHVAIWRRAVKGATPPGVGLSGLVHRLTLGRFGRKRLAAGDYARAKFQGTIAAKMLASKRKNWTAAAQHKLTFGLRVARLPILQRFGPTAVGVLANAPGKGAETILQEVTNTLADVLAKNIDSQIDLLIKSRASASLNQWPSINEGSEST